ncbi:hypothetical protein WDU94_008955 [Cyamophila willieti]
MSVSELYDLLDKDMNNDPAIQNPVYTILLTPHSRLTDPHEITALNSTPNTSMDLINVLDLSIPKHNKKQLSIKSIFKEPIPMDLRLTPLDLSPYRPRLNDISPTRNISTQTTITSINHRVETHVDVSTQTNCVNVTHCESSIANPQVPIESTSVTHCESPTDDLQDPSESTAVTHCESPTDDLQVPIESTSVTHCESTQLFKNNIVTHCESSNANPQDPMVFTAVTHCEANSREMLPHTESISSLSCEPPSLLPETMAHCQPVATPVLDFDSTYEENHIPHPVISSLPQYRTPAAPSDNLSKTIERVAICREIIPTFRPPHERSIQHKRHIKDDRSPGRPTKRRRTQ